MPEYRTLPGPQVDPYAGQAGKLIGELVSNIGQIYKLRQQRNQTDAVLDIMKNPNLTREEQQNAVMGVLKTAGAVLRNELARIYTADLFMPEMEKRQRQAQTELMESRAKYYREGGAGKTTTPLSHAALTAAQKTMETNIENASQGHKWGPNYPQDSLLTAWQNTKVQIGFDDLPYNQQQQLWQAWNTKLKAKGGQFEWNPENPYAFAEGPQNPDLTEKDLFKSRPLQPGNFAPALASPEVAGGKGAIENEFAGYMDKLDEQSKDELRQIIEEYTEAENKDRTKINTALQMLRDRYGNLR